MNLGGGGGGVHLSENGNKLQTYRLYKSNLIAEDYVKFNMERSHRRIIAKFRSGELALAN